MRATLRLALSLTTALAIAPLAGCSVLGTGLPGISQPGVASTSPMSAQASSGSAPANLAEQGKATLADAKALAAADAAHLAKGEPRAAESR